MWKSALSDAAEDYVMTRADIAEGRRLVEWSAYMREYRSANRGARCSRCSSTDLLSATRCATCMALDAERKPWLDGMRHETLEHALLMRKARLVRSRCSLSGLTLAQLRAGDRRGARYSLQVDRIDDAIGYVRGNMRLLACRLNRAKQGLAEVSRYDLNEFLARFGLADAPPVRAFMGEHGGGAY